MNNVLNKIQIPERIKLANMPTKIEKLERFSKMLGGPNIYIKRDDQTGLEVSGNKIRKLEFTAKDAINKGANVLITCGGIQSNHCRATAAVAARLGIKSVLVLRGSSNIESDGNLFIDKLLGADIRFITAEEYKNSRSEIMEQIKKEYDKKGYTSYIIPEGASNVIGTFGYYNAMKEIIEQEQELGVHFDKVILPVGSGGTYAGTFLANKILENKCDILGVNVCDDSEYFKNRIYEIVQDTMKYINIDLELSKDEIRIIDGYVGKVYALSREEEINFIKEFAKLEGIILDPVYTGKAMYGLSKEIKKGNFKNDENILFIHTGGAFGIFPQKELFKY